MLGAGLCLGQNQFDLKLWSGGMEQIPHGLHKDAPVSFPVVRFIKLLRVPMGDELPAQVAVSQAPGGQAPSIAVRTWLGVIRRTSWAVASPAQGVDRLIAPFDFGCH